MLLTVLRPVCHLKYCSFAVATKVEQRFQLSQCCSEAGGAAVAVSRAPVGRFGNFTCKSPGVRYKFQVSTVTEN